jgi:AraC-like DNA-binding protein
MAAGARGVDTRALLSDVGLPAATLEDPEARVSLDVVRALYREAALRTGDVDFGLHLGERIPRGAFGLLEYAAGASATLGDALRQVVRYTRLVDQSGETHLTVEGARATFRHALPGDPEGATRHAAEFILAGMLSFARQATGVDLQPREVRFEHPAPERTAEHQRVFRAPVRFGRAENALVLEAAHLRLPLTTSDPELVVLLDRHARELLARLPEPHSFADRLRHELLPHLAEGEPRMDEVARRLHVGARTLQRRLSEEGTHFREVLDSLRRELALRHVREGAPSLSELGFLLGFQEPSAFHRAFRRWTGTTPSAWRGAQAAARPASARSRK